MRDSSAAERAELIVRHLIRSRTASALVFAEHLRALTRPQIDAALMIVAQLDTSGIRLGDRSPTSETRQVADPIACCWRSGDWATQTRSKRLNAASTSRCALPRRESMPEFPLTSTNPPHQNRGSDADNRQ